MAYQLGDVFIGSFPITQNFGDRPDVYNALYNLKGHNGTDFGCPSGTQILSAADGVVTEIGSEALKTFDAHGYGNYVKVVHAGYLTLYGHLNDSIVTLGQYVKTGQLLGHSNNSGNSTGPHLHFGVAPCDVNGNKTQVDNGYSGYIDPMGADCIWAIKNPTEPIVPGQDKPVQYIEVKNDEFLTMVGQGSSYKVVLSYLIQQGMNQYMAATGKATIDINDIVPHPVQGEDVVDFLHNRFSLLSQLQSTPVAPVADLQTQVASLVQQAPVSQQASFFSSILSSLKNWAFTSK